MTMSPPPSPPPTPSWPRPLPRETKLKQCPPLYPPISIDKTTEHPGGPGGFFLFLLTEKPESWTGTATGQNGFIFVQAFFYGQESQKHRKKPESWKDKRTKIWNFCPGFFLLSEKTRIMKRHTTKWLFCPGFFLLSEKKPESWKGTRQNGFFWPDYFPENFANSELKQDYIFA